MKKLLLCFIFVIAFNLTGYKSSDTNNAEKDNPPDKVHDTVSVTEEQKTSVVSTKYYTVEIPVSWEKDCFHELTEKEHNNYKLSFYDKASREEINGGWLFSVDLLDETEDYLNFPDYEILGSVEVHNIGSYNIIVTYPTDVQFSENTAKKYSELKKEVPDILKTISFNDECVFSKEPIPVLKAEETKPQVSARFIGKWKDLGIGSRVPNGAKRWNVEFRNDGTGTFEFVFEADDIVTADFEFEPFETYLGETMDGILIKADGGADIVYMAKYTWSNKLQKTLMTMYKVKDNGVPNLDVYWVYAND